jgi:hypothetical protein
MADGRRYPVRISLWVVELSDSRIIRRHRVNLDMTPTAEAIPTIDLSDPRWIDPVRRPLAVVVAPDGAGAGIDAVQDTAESRLEVCPAAVLVLAQTRRGVPA